MQSHSQVQIENVKFNNIWGTSTDKVAVKLQCSQTAPCKDVELAGINLVHRGIDGPATALCENVSGWTRGKISPPSCIWLSLFYFVIFFIVTFLVLSISICNTLIMAFVTLRVREMDFILSSLKLLSNAAKSELTNIYFHRTQATVYYLGI